MRRWLRDPVPEIPQIPEMGLRAAASGVSGKSGISGRHLPTIARHTPLPMLDAASLDRWVQFAERAAIIEFDGGYSRAEADAWALAEIEASRPKS